MEVLALAPNLHPPRPGTTAAQTRKAAEDFEAVFLAQMLQPMFETVEVDGLFGGGQAEETWRSLWVEETAKHIARGGGVGLADMVEKEMLKMQEVADGAHANS
jgi:Rod binding domain-containing protein